MTVAAFRAVLGCWGHQYGRHSIPDLTWRKTIVSRELFFCLCRHWPIARGLVFALAGFCISSVWSHLLSALAYDLEVAFTPPPPPQWERNGFLLQPSGVSLSISVPKRVRALGGTWGRLLTPSLGPGCGPVPYPSHLRTYFLLQVFGPFGLSRKGVSWPLLAIGLIACLTGLVLLSWCLQRQDSVLPP